MIRTLSKLTFLFSLIAFTVNGQNKPSLSDKFFVFLNSYETDSLENILADDFILKRTYTTYSNDKSSFLNTYLPHSKIYNGKFKILKMITEGETEKILVEDRSDYFKYLRIDYPTWKITITTNSQKIKHVTIDTTEAYRKYMADVKKTDEKFKLWLKKNYPEDTDEMLASKEGILLKRLKKYAKKQK